MYRIAVCDDQIETVLHIAKLINQNFGNQYKVLCKKENIIEDFEIE